MRLWHIAATGHNPKRRAGAAWGGSVLSAAIALSLLALAAPAQAAPPTHLPLPSETITGLNHACGTAVDSEGDVYVSSAGESKVKVFDAAHTLLASISNSNEPCGLAVDTRGTLYVSERATGNVVRYLPGAYPLTASPAYGAVEAFDASGAAKGISVDQSDDRLYVAEGNRVSVYQSDGTRGGNEVVPMGVAPAVTGGTYTLSFEGQSSGPIPYNATPAQLQAALEGVSTIGAGNVSVEEGRGGTRSYLIAFTHALGSRDVPSLEKDESGLVGGNPGSRVSFFFHADGFEFSGHIGEGALSGATAVAAFTYSPAETPRHFLFVADSSNRVEVFQGGGIDTLEPVGAIDGKSVPDSPACPNCSEGFGFGAAGTALAVDWASGHLFVYDASHGVLDEFEASGHYLDQMASASFADASPSGVAVLPERSALEEITPSSSEFKLGYEGAQTAVLSEPSAAQVQAALEALPAIGVGNVSVSSVKGSPVTYKVKFTGALAARSVGRITLELLNGGSNPKTIQLAGYGPGRVYVATGAGAGAELLAFGPLAAPSRAQLPEPLSHALVSAKAVATDTHGDVYVVAGAKIHIYDPTGAEIAVGPGGDGIEDSHAAADISIDSAGRVYVLDEEGATYYTPSAYPPTSGTAYARHEPPIATVSDFPAGEGPLSAVAVNPESDRVFVSTLHRTKEFDSAAPGHASALLNANFAAGVSLGVDRYSIAVDGSSGDVYFAEHGGNFRISSVNPGGTKVIARLTGAGSPNGQLNNGPNIAVDQSNGHILVYSPDFAGEETAHEYDASGGFVAEFGEQLSGGPYDIATDSACALHDPPLDESTIPSCAEFDPADGNVYVVNASPISASHPQTVTAFGPLAYGAPPQATTGTTGGLGAGNATLNGTVDPAGFDLTACRFEYLTDAEYEANKKAQEEAEEPVEPFTGAATEACVEGLAEIGKGNAAVPVHADIGGLDPEGRYRYRLVAENKYGPGEGDAALFGPPVVKTKAALPVLYDEATLRADVDPSGLATKYHFEYVTEGHFEAEGFENPASTPEAALAGGEGPVAAQTTLTGLEEGVRYRFRIVAQNEAGGVAASDRSFETLQRPAAQDCENAAYRTGLSANLPDCRAYELTTPAQTNGLAPVALAIGSWVDGAGFNNWLATPRGPEAGNRLSYFTNGTLPGFDGNGVYDGYRAQRGSGEHPQGGWTSELFAPSYPQSAPDLNHGVSQQSVASDQLYSFWRLAPSEALSGTLEAGVYLRTPGEAAGSGCNPEPQQGDFELVGCGSLGVDQQATGHYISPGGAHVLFSSTAHLEDESPPAGTKAVYDRAAGKAAAQVVSLQPGGAPFGAGEDATYVGAGEDGTAVLFKVAGTLYLRRGGETIEVATAPNRFAGISEDGTRVLYTSGSTR